LAAMTALGEQLAADTKWSTKKPRIHPCRWLWPGRQGLLPMVRDVGAGWALP
jgi:hypothetical protein